MTFSNANWWQFSIEPETRDRKILDGETGAREINPTYQDGRRLIDYGDYLDLDTLLAAQIPASETPDERVFITTHHFFEIAFKQMIFDLTVISKTFERILNEPDDQEFRLLCTAETAHADFWLPATTAANRLRYSAETALPVFFHFLDKSAGRDETFSSREYFKFRPFLPPASGFQSAQFRLLQRAFGKAGLFAIRLFPAQEYSRDYTGKDSADLIKITEKTVLRDDTEIANPNDDSPLKQAADIEVFANSLLTRLADFVEITAEAAPLRLIETAEVETAVESFRRILTIHRKDQEKIGEKPANADEFDQRAVTNFQSDLEAAATRENGRRRNLQNASRAAIHLQKFHANSGLTKVFSQLSATDTALFGQQETSFLSLHLQMAADRIRELQEHARAASQPEQPAGTGGGGVPYLSNIRSSLINFFPFLVAFRSDDF